MQLSLKSQKLRLIFLILFLGIFFGRTSFLAPYFLFFGSLFCAISIIFRSYFLFVVALFFLGNFYGQYRNESIFQNDILPQFYNEEVEIVGWVKSFPDMRQKNNRVFLQVVEIKKKDKVFQGKFLGKLLFIYPKEQIIDYGDRIKFSGKILKPRNFDGFDYQKYLKRFGVRGILKNPQNIGVLSQGTEGYRLIRWAKKFRNSLAQNLSDTLPVPHDQIAMGILLGVKKELPKEIAQNFKNSGLTHILVVSGFNVSVLMVFCAMILKYLGRRAIFFGSMVMLLFFLLMVGSDPPVLRATIFGGILAWAYLSGKFSDGRNLLFLTAVILAIISPQMIQQDIGFFLSFFATFGIILALPIFQKIFTFLPERFEIRSLVSVIIAAQISVFPILSLYFGVFPIIGFFSNIFIEPLVPIGMFFSFMTTATLPLLGENLILVFSFPAKIVLNIILFIAGFFGGSKGVFIPQILAQISLGLVLCFFLWGSFSFWYQKRFLEG